MKTNILHIVDSFEPGGTERQAVQLVRLLNESGRYRVHLACLQKRGALLDEAESFGLGEIGEYPLKSFYDPNFVSQVRRLTRYLKKHDIELVHTHDFYTNIFGMTAAALTRTPIRIASKRETDGFRNSMQRRAERGAYSLAHAVVVNAKAVGQRLTVAGVDSAKVVTIHNGLNRERISSGAEMDRGKILSMLGLPTKDVRHFVTIVANLQHEVKDHPTFLRAAARVREACPQAAFIIAGEGRLRESLGELSKQLGLESDLFFIGRCENIAGLLSVSDVCVLSSKAEGFSNAILEYMAAARPVVATDVGGAREAIADGETGYVVPPADDLTMASRIIELLNVPERARAMGQRGQLVVAEKFSREAQRDRTIGLYDRLLSSQLQRKQQAVATLRRERA